MMQLDVMAAAEPPHIQGFIVSIMMCIDLGRAADLATLSFQCARGKRPLNGKMGQIFR